jgi:hypothetical protein
MNPDARIIMVLKIFLVIFIKVGFITIRILKVKYFQLPLCSGKKGRNSQEFLQQSYYQPFD